MTIQEDHRHVRLLLVVSTAVFIAACAPPPPAGFSEADEATIMASSEAWEAASDARDWAALATYYTDDAVFMAPNMPAMQGRAAIEEWHAQTPPGTELDLAVVEIGGSGDMAYVYGTYTMSYPVGDEVATDVGKYIEIRRKQDDGSWPIIRDIFNSDVPVPEAEPEM